MEDIKILSTSTAVPVLSVLQAPGCNFTVLEPEDLSPFTNLKALHLQGYAHKKKKQYSGFVTNRITEMVSQKEALMKSVNDPRQDLTFALAEDSLHSLTKLQILDLQSVRLVSAREPGRPRRHSAVPIATDTIIDLPVKNFVLLANLLDGFLVPPEFVDVNDNSGNDKKQELPTARKMNSYKEELEIHLLDSSDDSIVPYEVYREATEPQLAPFKNLGNLLYLRVANARLDRVGTELLSGLSNLITLALEHNKIKVLPTNVFSPTPNLKYLSVAHNKILTLDAESLSGLSSLLNLDLSHNRISVIGPASFPKIDSLRILQLQGNPIQHVLPDTFLLINITEHLFIGKKQVSSELHKDAFRHLNSLKKLSVENITFPLLKRGLLKGTSKLQKLILHGNIPIISYDAFADTPFLSYIDMSNCNTSKISMDAFFGLKYLQFLDLSYNNLEEITPGTFDHLVSLRELYLHHNNLKTLPLGIFDPLPVKVIQLHSNPWHCSCAVLQLRPGLTNKKVTNEETSCRWNENKGIMCKEGARHIKYDTRVAPLCATPSKYQRKNAFHVAFKNLKCSKYYLKVRSTSIKTKNATTIQINSILSKDKLGLQVPSKWVPLTDFTIPPMEPKDLLVIARLEMPKEAYAPLFNKTDLQDSNPIGKIISESITNVNSNYNIIDSKNATLTVTATSKAESVSTTASNVPSAKTKVLTDSKSSRLRYINLPYYRIKHQEEKKKIKEQEEQKKQLEKMEKQAKKLILQKHKEEKLAIKANIAIKEKEIQKQKRKEWEEFLKLKGHIKN